MKATENLRRNLRKPLNLRKTLGERNHNEEMGKRQAALMATRREILADCAKPLQAMREASLAMSAIGSKVRGKQFQGYVSRSSLRVYSVQSGDNGNGMEDNSPMWTNGHALAARDTATT